MLEDIDESLRSHYYPFILEDIDNFYDQIKDICVRKRRMNYGADAIQFSLNIAQWDSSR